MPQRVDSGLRLLGCKPRLQTSNDVQPPGTSVLHVVSSGRDLPLHGRGNEDGGVVSRSDTAKAGLRHADDGEGVGIDRNTLVNDARIGTKSPLPIIETQ